MMLFLPVGCSQQLRLHSRNRRYPEARMRHMVPPLPACPATVTGVGMCWSG